MIKVGDKVRWHSEGYEVVLAVTSTHAFVVDTDTGGSLVERAPLSALGLAGFALMLGAMSARCALGFHRRPPGVRPEMSIFWVCASCGAPVPGHLAARRSRR